MLTIIICKLLVFLGSLIGRGSSLPGLIALKLDKNILSKLTLPERTLAITGSNGKTSITELVRATAENAGLRVVCNSYGSNQIEGVATALLAASDLKGRVSADAVYSRATSAFVSIPSSISRRNIFSSAISTATSSPATGTTALC